MNPSSAHQDLPPRLYKYVPAKYSGDVLDGSLLFRNLVFFRQVEDEARGDPTEGMHLDQPDSPITVESLDGKIRTTAKAFHNEIDQERVFAFCLSTVLSESLRVEFGESVVEITDVPALVSRIGRAVRKHPSLRKSGLLHGPVEYYRSDRPASSNIKDPGRLPFFKLDHFSSQQEYRFVCSQKGGLTLRQSLVSHDYSLSEEIARMRVKEKLLRIGSLRDIARLAVEG